MVEAGEGDTPSASGGARILLACRDETLSLRSADEIREVGSRGLTNQAVIFDVKLVGVK